MPFDPNKPFEVGGFDPNKPFEVVEAQDEKNDALPEERDRTLIGAGKELLEGAGHLGKSMINAAMSPVENLTDALTSSPAEVMQGANRMLRSTPIVGPMVDKAQTALYETINPKGNYKERQDYSDALHAKEKPVADALQKMLPWLALAPISLRGQFLATGIDTWSRSIEDGASPAEALQDGTNAVVLSAGSLLGVKGISPATNAVGRGIVGAGKAITRPIKTLHNVANKNATKAALGSSIRETRNAAKVGIKDPKDLDYALKNIDDFGSTLLEEGIIDYGDSVGDIAGKAAEGRRNVGKEIRNVGQYIDDVSPEGAVSGDNIAAKFRKLATEELGDTKGEIALRKYILEEAAMFEQNGAMPFDAAQHARNQFKYEHGSQNVINSNKSVSSKLNQIVAEEMDATARSPKYDPDFTGGYPDSKRRYSALKTASGAGTDRALKDFSNRFVSPSDYGTGGVFTVGKLAKGASPVSAIAEGVAVGAANKVARQYGRSTVARGAFDTALNLEKLYGRLPLKSVMNLGMDLEKLMNSPFGGMLMNAAKESPKSLAITHYSLSQKDPEYKKLMSGD